MTYRVAAVAAYIASIVAANWLTSTFGLVSIGFGLLVTAGTFAAGGALILRDWVDRAGGRWLVVAAIALGIAVSYVIANPVIALASAVAFAASELVDWGVFAPLRDRTLPGAVLASSVVSAPVDTVLFLAIAGFPVTFQAVLGQFLVKTTLALVVACGLLARERQVA